MGWVWVYCGGHSFQIGGDSDVGVGDWEVCKYPKSSDKIEVSSKALHALELKIPNTIFE